MKKAAFILFLVLITFQQVSAQKEISLGLLKGSSLTIYGSSNIVPFKIQLKGDNFPVQNLSIYATQSENKIFVSEKVFSIDVKKFTSDNRMALRDFKKLIKSDRYPEISVEITSLEFNSKTSDQESTGSATGFITITGIKKEYRIPLSYNKFNNVYYAEGKLKLSIKDFGLNPPSEMLGLIKVNEWIDIEFNLNFYLDKLNVERNSLALVKPK